ncbi:hypothetical protein AAG906_014272 [Vitis piasezkii]
MIVVGLEQDHTLHFKPKPSWEEEIHWLTAYKSLAVQVNQSLSINPGNSRDPLLDSKGRMSGIDTAIFTQTGGPGHGCLVKIRTSSLFNWDKSMGIKMFDGDSFHSEKNKKSILVDDSFMIQPQSIVDDQSNSHFGTDISMVADIAGVTQPQTAEHVMTSWTLEMDYANNISSTEADRGPSDIETTGCINDELASNGKSIGSTNSGASKEKFLLKKQGLKPWVNLLYITRCSVHLHSHFVCSCIRCYLS